MTVGGWAQIGLRPYAGEGAAPCWGGCASVSASEEELPSPGTSPDPSSPASEELEEADDPDELDASEALLLVELDALDALLVEEASSELS